MHVSRSDLEKVVAEQRLSSELSDLRSHLQECLGCQTELVAKLHEESAEVAPTNSNAAARIKVLDPIMSLAPSAPAHLLTASSRSLHLRVSRYIFIGALVHVRSSFGLAFGHVRYCIPAGSEFQVGVKLESTDQSQKQVKTHK
jgi:hypothetical protein